MARLKVAYKVKAPSNPNMRISCSELPEGMVCTVSKPHDVFADDRFSSIAISTCARQNVDRIRSKSSFNNAVGQAGLVQQNTQDVAVVEQFRKVQFSSMQHFV